MSDPGTSYRTREEVQRVRQERDPIRNLQAILVELGWTDEDKVRAMEREIRSAVEVEVAGARSDPSPGPEELWSDIYTTEPAPGPHRGCIDYEE